MYNPVQSSELSVKSRRQRRWRSWVINVIYAITDLYDGEALTAFAMLETSAQTDIVIMYTLVERYGLQNLVRFKRAQVAFMVCGEGCPPEFPEPPPVPTVTGAADSLCSTISGKCNRASPDTLLSEHR